MMNNSENTISVNPKKKTDRHSIRLPFLASLLDRSPFCHLIVIALFVFFCETLDMLILSLFPISGFWTEIIIDSGFLVTMLSPILYFFLYRPLMAHIKERDLSEKSLRESEARFRNVFQTSPDSITVNSLEDGKILSFNEGFTALFGFAAEDVIGKSIFDINIWNDPKTCREFFATLKEKGQVNNVEAKLMRKDGQFITGLISARINEVDGKSRFLTVTRDISEWKETSRKLSASNHYLQIANKHKKMGPLLNEFVAKTQQLTDCSAIGIRLIDGQGNLPFKATMGYGGRFCKADNPCPLKVEKCLCIEVVRPTHGQKSPFFTEFGSFSTNSNSHLVATDSEKQKQKMCDCCENKGYESLALIPIRTEDSIHGLIYAADTRKNLISPEILDILEGAAMQLCTAIERVRAVEVAQNSNRVLEKRVKGRTQELLLANENLNIEIVERKSNEKKLREQQAKLRSLSSELLLTEERERRRIATELHDRIGQSLAITKIKLGEIRETLPSGSGVEELEKIRQFIDQTIQDTRTLTFELSPPVLYELGLEAGLEWLVNQIQKKHHIRIELNNGDQFKVYDESCHVLIFQATRELLLNVVKHAQAKNVVVSFRKNEETTRIEIIDDGVGFNTKEFDSSGIGSLGFGIFSVRERLNPLGGNLEIESEPGRGTRASIVLPLSCKIETLCN